MTGVHIDTESAVTEIDETLITNLLRNYPDSAQAIIVPLAEIATSNRAYGEEVCSILVQSLRDDSSVQCTRKVILGILELLPDYADELAAAGNDLVDMCHGELTVRTLTYLTVHTNQVNTHEVATVLTDILEQNQLQSADDRVVTWGLTKLGLDDPDAITPARRALVDVLAASHPDSGELTELLTPEDNECPDALHASRLYAAEALAVNATGHIETKTHEPPADPMGTVPNHKTAAWGLQQCVSETDLEFDDLGLHKKSKSVQHHGIAKRLIDPLQDRAQNTNDRVAIASILALGYLGPNDELKNEVRQTLGEIAGKDNQRGEAAEWVLTNPGLPIYQDDALAT